jgi:hypothetical protein
MNFYDYPTAHGTAFLSVIIIIQPKLQSNQQLVQQQEKQSFNKLGSNETHQCR